MINISRPWWPSDSVLIADPFVGTGTVYLESLKFLEVNLSCSDLEPVSPLLAKDNLDFFAMSAAEIKSLRNRIGLLIGGEGSHSEHVPRRFRRKKPDEAALNWAIDFSSKVHPNGDFTVATFTKETVEELETQDAFTRFLFYLTLRTTIRSIQGLDREVPSNDEVGNAQDTQKEDNPWWRAFKREAESLDIQLGRLERLKETQVIHTEGAFTVVTGKRSYSRDCSLDCKRLKAESASGSRLATIRVADARELERDARGNTVKYDVIITDPPYGFNTNETASSLAHLYASVIRKMIDALADDGQLVICLPERSHTGRRSLYFTHKQIVTQQIFSEAENAGREVLYSAFLVPPPSSIFRPPYYWESERALRRSILHFRLRKTPIRDSKPPPQNQPSTVAFDLS